MKIKRYLTILLTALVFETVGMSMTSFAANSDLLVTNQEEAKKGVVVVENAVEGYGSGFAVGIPGEPVQYFITNQHVVGNYTTATVCYSLAENKRVEAHVIARDLQKDLALLKIPSPTTERAALKLCEEEYVTGKFTTETYYALGYPSEDYRGSEYITMDENSVSATSGIISGTDTIEGNNVYRMDVDINSGNSGGPLVNGRGEVVGIIAFTMTITQTDEDGVKTLVGSSNCAVIVDQLINMLDDNRVKFESYSGETPAMEAESLTDTGRASKTMPGAGGTPGTEDVQAAVTDDRGPQETAAAKAVQDGADDKAWEEKKQKEEKEAEKEQTGEKQENRILVPIMIGTGFFILVVVIILLVIMNLRGGKRNKPAQSRTPENPAPPVSPVTAPVWEVTKPVPRASLTVISGVQKGLSVQLDNRVVIGRDGSRCQMVFPQDCPGVSGVHCEVFFQDGSCHLHDLDSRYGTFLSDGTRLTKGMTAALEDGDTFYLAESANTVEIHL